MSVQSAYRRVPEYFAVPLALLASAVISLAFAFLAAGPLDLVLESLLHRQGEAGLAVLLWFCATPSITILAFVSSFSALIHWHHATSWPVPTFALAFGTVLVWVWARDFGGIGPGSYIAGAFAWLVICWFLTRNTNINPRYVIEA